MTLMEAAAPEKVQLNKKIYGFAELDSAITEKARLKKETDLSRAVLQRALHYANHAHVAQLEERVVAVARHNCINLMYGHTSPGCGLESLDLQQNVNVYPAQGGRTSYEINMQVNGYFANKNLPLRAKDRGGKSIYRNTRWYYGQGEMYMKGNGPAYLDVGPSCMHRTLEQSQASIQAADWIPALFREKAVLFMDKVADAVDPFGDAVLRYELCGFNEAPASANEWHFAMSSWVSSYEMQYRSKYGVVIRIKHPSRLKNGMWDTPDDLALAVAGPLLGHEDPHDVLYMVSRLHPGQGQGRVCSRSYGHDDDHPVMHSLYCKTSSVINVVRQWCADRLNIPSA